ncbi:MAG: hypothetical protein K0S74_604 [Chlamydiales bacterium]|jgi:ferritin-like metal-binding protein YciE|nr:hypothetical protein [Chlamydiales bacterium]
MDKNTNFELLFETALRHLYHAEHDIRDNLAVMIQSASATELKDAFAAHKQETQGQIERLEKVFQLLGIDLRKSKTQGITDATEKGIEMLKTLADMNFTDRSKGIEGILNEGKELIRHFAGKEAGDLALTSAAKKVEHFEIACYEFVCFLAEHYGYQEVLSLLQANLEEEKRANETFSHLARTSVQLPAALVAK